MSIQNNTAYDFDRFSPQQDSKKKNNVVQMPVPRPQPHKKMALGPILRRAAVCAICFGMFGGLIYNQMTINELNTTIQKQSASLNRSQNEYIQLEMAAQARMTTEEVERYAVDVLGMQKLQNNQIEYIRMNDQDKIEIADSGNQSLWEKIQNWFLGIFS